MPISSTATSTERLFRLMATWHELLSQWAQDGHLAAAAEDALVLSGQQTALDALLAEWSSGTWNQIPRIELLEADTLKNAAGAYVSTLELIVLNEAWLEQASDEAILFVLTEELGHWLDDRLNSEDTPGDEGAQFATLLLGEPDSSWGLASWQERGDDSTTLLINGEWVAVELAAVAGQTIDFRGSTEPQIINGSFGDDIIYGGDGGDTIFGDAGNDMIYGGAGNDTIDGGFGNDTIYGGDGDDRITSNNGSNNLYGEGGNDVLVARNLTGTHVLDGGSGDDLLIATGLNVTLVSTMAMTSCWQQAGSKLTAKKLCTQRDSVSRCKRQCRSGRSK
jgi:hypothetical protein